MATERQPLSGNADSPAEDAAPVAPLTEAQLWWDEQMAEARRWYHGKAKPMYPRPMTPEEAKAWLAESERRLRALPWKPWPGSGTTTGDRD